MMTQCFWSFQRCPLGSCQNRSHVELASLQDFYNLGMVIGRKEMVLFCFVFSEWLLITTMC